MNEQKPEISEAPYSHPTTLLEFEKVYRGEYAQELDGGDGWIKWCQNQNPPDTHGINFHQGMKRAHIFNNIKMEQLLRILKQQTPNQNTQLATLRAKISKLEIQGVEDKSLYETGRGVLCDEIQKLKDHITELSVSLLTHKAVSKRENTISKQAEEIERLKNKCNKYEIALEKLARLGNEPLRGNSIGNCIASDALNHNYQ